MQTQCWQAVNPKYLAGFSTYRKLEGLAQNQCPHLDSKSHCRPVSQCVLICPNQSQCIPICSICPNLSHCCPFYHNVSQSDPVCPKVSKLSQNIPVCINTFQYVQCVPTWSNLSQTVPKFPYPIFTKWEFWNRRRESRIDWENIGYFWNRLGGFQKLYGSLGLHWDRVGQI